MKLSAVFAGLISLVTGALAWRPPGPYAQLPNREVRIISQHEGQRLCLSNINGNRTAGNPIRPVKCTFSYGEHVPAEAWLYKNYTLQWSPSTAANGTEYCLEIETNEDTDTRTFEYKYVLNPCRDHDFQNWYFFHQNNNTQMDLRMVPGAGIGCVKVVGVNDNEGQITPDECNPQRQNSRWTWSHFG
ncbi:hypothetical protein EC968_002805 [Mortierella alpina]|nr:hypothetical protein EC968_002805 [Mortierella alpina]